jgi:hypothetical protein
LAAATVIGGLLLGNASPARAVDFMRSDSYVIQLGNFNITSGTKTGGGYTVTDTLGQLAAGEFTGTGYRVFAGFQYLYALPRFSFRILGLSIDLGTLTPGVFNSATNQLVISTRGAGYRILAAADHTLRSPGGAGEIPHTPCDSSCSISAAGVWSNAFVPGFGFNVAGTHRSTDFTDGTYFRPFADREDSQLPQPIAEHNAIVEDDVLTVTYQAAVGGDAPGGILQTAIDYIAVPSY